MTDSLLPDSLTRRTTISVAGSLFGRPGLQFPLPALRRSAARRLAGLRTLEGLICLLVLAALLADRLRLLTQFGFRYADEDQALLWYAAEEAFHGRFHEPCFFGQSYKTTMEGLLAVPLYALGVPLPYALPIVTSLLGLLPFVMVSILAWCRDQKKLAALLLLVPLVLPIPYAMVAAIPRGFVTGLACAAPAMLLFLTGRNPRHWFLAGLCGVLAITVNPNAVILLIAVGVFAILGRWRSLSFWGSMLAGAALGSVAPLGIATFYSDNPAYDLHRHPPLEFKGTLWHQAIAKLDLFMGPFVPWTQAHSGLGALLILGGLALVLLIVRQWRGAFALAAAGGACVLALGVNRIHESGTSVFLSGSRMFLAIPVLYALGLFWAAQGLNRWHLHKAVSWCGFAALGGLALLIVVPRHWAYHTEVRLALLDRTLQIYRTPECEHDARLIAETAAAQGTNMVVFTAEHDKTLVYAVPALTAGRCETIFPGWDRRTWRLEEESRAVRPRTLIYFENRRELWGRAVEQFPGHVELVSESPRIMAIEAPEMTALDVTRSLGIATRPY